MKIKLSELKYLITDGLLRGVPDFELREATSRFVKELKKHILHYVNVAPGDITTVDKATVMRSIDDTLIELESDIHELLEAKIYKFLQTV